MLLSIIGDSNGVCLPSLAMFAYDVDDDAIFAD